MHAKITFWLLFCVYITPQYTTLECNGHMVMVRVSMTNDRIVLIGKRFTLKNYSEVYSVCECIGTVYACMNSWKEAFNPIMNYIWSWRQRAKLTLYKNNSSELNQWFNQKNTSRHNLSTWSEYFCSIEGKVMYGVLNNWISNPFKIVLWVSDCCLMPIQQFSSYIMVKTS